MERNKRTLCLFLLFAPFLVCTIRADPCPDTGTPPENLTCYNDYNHTLTCEWNSSNVSDNADNVCTIHAKWEGWSRDSSYSGSCKLEPVDVSRPALKRCSVNFTNPYRFKTFHTLNITLNCKNPEQTSSFSYNPVCHIKLNPPTKPNINLTTGEVSWFPQTEKHGRFDYCSSQIQWKQGDQSWSEAFKQVKKTECTWNCTAELSHLIRDEKHEVRVRVQVQRREESYWSVWSDWSPTTSWVSPIGDPKPTPTPTPPPGVDIIMSVSGTTAFIVVFVLLLLFFRTDRTRWTYIVKRIKGPPLPNPEKSFLQNVDFQSWLSPHFTSESLHSFLKPVEIISVEVTSTLDAVSPSRPKAVCQEKMRSESSHESTSFSLSNPNYSQLSLPPPISSLTEGNLKACDADAPYGPVGGQGEGENAEQERDAVRGKEVEVLELLSKGSNINEPMLVISDYEKVERPEGERLRLQSLDSGMCSGEEVSQESLETDSINVGDCHDDDDDLEEKGEREAGIENKVDLKKLFSDSGGNFDKGSIQVCFGYEQVQKLQADSPELLSMDSGMSSGGEEQLSQEESLEDIDKSTESTSLLSPPPLLHSPGSSALACSLTSFIPVPLNFSGAALSPALQPLPSHILEQIILMSSNKSVEPSGDGYLPVRQK